MFARFDENPAMTLQDIKKKNVTDGRTHGRTYGQRENSIPTTNKVCGGIIIKAGQIRIIPAKFGQNPASSLGVDVH